MARQMRFHYAGGWTRWYTDDEAMAPLKAIGSAVDSVEISEEMTRAEFVQQFPDHILAK